MSALTDSQAPKPLKSSNTGALPALSDVFVRLECKLNVFQSAIRTPKARAAALATVDQDIDAAKRLILSVLTRCNMLVPISILPAEILARIFRFIAFSKPPHSHRPMPGSVYFTQVCRRWRQVALDDSTLWTRFLDSSQDKYWITKRLSRARNAPLVIKLSGSMRKDTFSLFTPHISHTRELYLRNLSLLHSDIVREISIQKAPALERFKLSVSSTSPMGIKHLVEHSFFKGPLPKLRVFFVSQILFPWSLIPRGQLTQLTVALNEEFLTSGPEASPHDDLNQLIDLLANCPALEVLTLENCLPVTLSESSGGQTIHLPRLSRLCLGGSSSRVTNLFKMLKLSSSTTLRLRCTSENATTQNEHLILPIISAHFNGPTPVKFRSLKIFLGHVDRRIEVVASTSLPRIRRSRIREADSDPELSLSFHRVAELNNRMDILRRACDVLSLSNLEFLSLSSPSQNQFIDWNKIFQHYTEVTTVRLNGCGTIGVLQALTSPEPANTTAGGNGGKCKRGDDANGAWARAPDNDDNDNHGPAPVHMPPFPKLTSLLLKELDFSNTVPGWDDLYDLIVSMVEQREATKTPLKTLCIERCVISADEADGLETFVPNFYWDYEEDPWESLATMFEGGFDDPSDDSEAESSDTDFFAGD